MNEDRRRDGGWEMVVVQVAKINGTEKEEGNCHLMMTYDAYC